jgi:hypothetical protein
MTALNLGTAPKVGTDSSCPAFTHPLSEGSTDATTNGEVTRLQKHLAQDPTLYPEAQVTGYFGPATERAVQRFQAKHGIANSGTPETTGYGSVGGQTRIKLGAMCTSTTVLKTEDTKTKTTTTPVAKVKRALSGSTYGLDDVESITYQVWGKPVPGHGYAVLGKAFTITLVDGTTRKVFDNGLAGTIQSATNFKLTASEYSKSKFGGIGYSGDVDALLAKAVKLSGVDTTDSKGKLPSTSG